MSVSINFLDKIPRIAERVGVLAPEQLADVDFVQAVFDVAHDQGVALVPPGQKPGDVLKNYKTVQEFSGVVKQYGLDPRAINEKAQMFKLGHEAQNAPYFMNVLEHFGHISPEQKNSLLAAQFSARTAEITAQVKSGKVSLPLDQALAQRPPMAHEPDYLKAAQNTEQSAKILAAAVAQHPELKNDPDVQRAFSALEVLSAQSFQKASDAAGKAPKLGLAGEEMLKQAAGQKAAFPLSKLASTSTLISKLESGMEKAAGAVAKTNPQQATVMRQQMATRKPEIQKLNVFGSLVLPDILMKKTKLTFAEQVTQSRNNPSQGRNF